MLIRMTLYMPIFRSCTSLTSLSQLHAHLLVTGYHRDVLASTKLIDTYAKVGSLESARLIFDSIPNPDSFMWGVLIKSYVWNFFFKEAILLYHEMLYQQPNMNNRFIFPSLLRACSGLGDRRIGRKIHGRIIKSGFESDEIVDTSLLCMYGESGSLDGARRIFDDMPMRDVVSWSSIISTYVEDGQALDGLEIFRRMVSEGIEPDSVTMLTVTEACAHLGFQKLAKSVHGCILRREIENHGSLENSLIVMYSKCRDLHGAERIFERASCRSTVSWTAMISCYNQMACFQEALDIFIGMQESKVEPSPVTMMSVILSCSQLGLLREGMSVHGFAIRRGIDPDFDLVGPALIEMYASCEKLGDCQKVFDAIQGREIVSWNSLIAVYARKGWLKEALRLFMQLRAEGLFPDSFTLASSLSACGNMGFSQLGSQIHGHVAKTGFNSNEFVQNSLIDMYSKCGFEDTAYIIFKKFQQKSVITWNSMVGGFVQNGNSIEAINLFDQMHSRDLEMDNVTFLSAIQACSHLGYLEKGKWIHNKLIVYGVEKDSYVDSALTDMYAKCGDLQMARTVFDNMLERSVVSWSAMIAGYGLHGHINAAISLFSQMLGSEIKPNEVTFLNILSACSHTGFVEEGKFYFSLMKRDFNIEPQLEHFACMVDLLSRAGDLDGAYEFIKSMPISANASIWGALLNGCRIHRRMDMIRSIQRNILDLEPDNSGYYILLSNIYGEGGNWDEFGKMRSMMKDIGLMKVCGYSVLEIRKKIYKFGAGDTSHPQRKEIYKFLEDLMELAKEQGYVERDPLMLSRKGDNVKSHSEKLAIAFGIMNSSPGTKLRIIKNLRTCMDCHTFTKFVSKITGREIILRDLNRFHHFLNGSCSCRDYW